MLKSERDKKIIIISCSSHYVVSAHGPVSLAKKIPTKQKHFFLRRLFGTFSLPSWLRSWDIVGDTSQQPQKTPGGAEAKTPLDQDLIHKKSPVAPTTLWLRITTNNVKHSGTPQSSDLTFTP